MKFSSDPNEMNAIRSLAEIKRNNYIRHQINTPINQKAQYYLGSKDVEISAEQEIEKVENEFESMRRRNHSRRSPNSLTSV